MRKLMIIAVAALMLAACAKTIPTVKPFDPASELKEANEKLAANYMEDGRIRLETIIRLDSTGEYAPIAQLRIADSYVMDDLPDLAVDEYNKFINTYPRHKYASYARYQIGMIHFNLIKGPDRGFGFAEKSLHAFQSLNDQYPRNPYREDVIIKIQQCRAILAEHEFQVGDFYFKKDSCKGATDRLEGVRTAYPDYNGMSQVLYRLAICYEKLGMKDQSAKAMNDLATGFPASALHQKALHAIEEIREEVREASE